MFKLANGMSFVLAALSYGFYPKKFVQIEISLVPTTGVVAVDPDTIDKYGTNWALYFDTAHDATKTIAKTLLGANFDGVKQWIVSQWQAYKVNPANVETQLKPIFEYATSVGVKP